MNSSTRAGFWPGRTRLIRLGLVVGMAMAGSVAAIAVPAAAQAAVVNVAVAAAAGTVAQDAVAYCPDGEYLAGASGGIIGGGGDITLTDVIPDIAAKSVTVWGHSNVAAPPAYTVVAQAICVLGPPPANYQLVTATSGMNAVTPKNVVAACPAGTQLLGGGAELRQAFGQAFYRWMLPNFALTTHTVLADATAALAGNWESISYAICGTPPGAAPARIAQTFIGGPSPTNAKTESTGPCVAGIITGVGATAAPGPAIAGYVFIDQISANLTQSEARASAVEGNNPGAGVAWDMAVYGICWTF